MKKHLAWFSLAIIFIFVGFSVFFFKAKGSEIKDVLYEESTEDTFGDDPYENWKRPEGPVRVGIQVGHWKIDDLPEEQEHLKPGRGTSWNNIPEWQVCLTIAEEVKKLLEEKGIVVDLIPSTVPINYLSDAFVSIHADGNDSPLPQGYKVASPRRDKSLNASLLRDKVNTSYGEATELVLDTNITKNMTGYYAFNYRKYQHAIHPMTPAIIVETGFLTNSFDRQLLLNKPELSAKGIAEGVIEFLQEEGLIFP